MTVSRVVSVQIIKFKAKANQIIVNGLLVIVLCIILIHKTFVLYSHTAVY